MEDKTIEVMSFMNTNKNPDTAQKMATRLVIHERKNNLRPEQRKMFEENSDRERQERLRNSVKKQKTIGKIKFYAGVVSVSALLIAGSSFALKREIDKRIQPIDIFRREVAADAGMIDLDGKTITDGKMTQEKLLQFAAENNLTNEQIEQVVEQISKSQNVDLEFLANKIRATNPGLISEDFGKPDLETKYTGK